MIPQKALRPCLWPIAPAILLALLAVPGLRASTEPFIAENPGPGSVTIDGKWQFHLGDSLNWSNPSFDDSTWEQLDGDDQWGDQTHPGYTGFAWYRKRIQISGRGAKMAVLIPQVDNAYEIYWNGRKIGDGVLEARSPRGELYGYDRLSTLMQAQPTVQRIVDAACSFGQDDDISVLSVALTADTESHDARLELSAQIAGL